ncbi:MAG: D-alanyl-D-alanine carboxypeptidase/D-alanyl-D-alanine-endopeptidase [Prevotella sp.]|nr:D-alanyl-D-alanine carboxypeptidase/D-alanyl-D-alanine-endopeptidase [Prevotella sp.]
MRSLLFLLFSCLCLSTWAQSDTLTIDTVVTDSLPWPQNVRVRMDSVLKTPSLQTTQVGLMVYDLTADSTLYTYGHRQTLRPASTMKLLTAVTGLSLLGANYRMNTSLYYSGNVSNGTLYGNVYCVGGMDPMFDSNDMNVFVNQLRHQGIDTIKGQILSDVSFKDEDRLGEGWCWDDDNPTLSPLLVDRKDYFTERLGRELRLDGVVIIDTVFSQGVKGRTFVCTRSHSVDELLVCMMKESDNLYAEALFYQLAAKAGKFPVKGKQATAQVRRMIQKVGMEPANYKVADGSGLSLYNYVSAELEVSFLRYVWMHPQMFDTLYPKLPIAGIDGTLKGRMLRTAAEDNVHAKTGTLTGITSLAGYCTAANGHMLCFAIINQGVMRTAEGRTLIDSLCVAMCE